MPELYLEFDQESREASDRQLTIEYVSTPEYQGNLDARQGAEPNPELINDRSYWVAYCKGLHARYCNKYESYPKQTFITAEMEELLF